MCFLARPDQLASLRAVLDEGIGLREITAEAARAMVPALRPGYAAGAAIEDDAFDMDVAALHQGFLRLHRRRGGTLALRSRTGRIERRGLVWEVEVTGGAVFRAPVRGQRRRRLGRRGRAQAGAAPLGLRPKRRTGVIIDPAPWQVSRLAAGARRRPHMVCPRPEARTRLMVCPEDETDMAAHDVQPDELDVAIAIDRMQHALDIEVRRIERTWAGLRTFTPDRSLAIGWDPAGEGFFWSVGQGGYGIQTAPAAGRLVADLLAGRDPGPAASVLRMVNPARFAAI